MANRVKKFNLKGKTFKWTFTALKANLIAPIVRLKKANFSLYSNIDSKTFNRLCGLFIIFNANPGNGNGYGGPDWFEILYYTASFIVGSAAVFYGRRFLSKLYHNYMSPAPENPYNTKPFRENLYEYISTKINFDSYPNLRFIKNELKSLPEYADIVDGTIRPFTAGGRHYLGIKIDFERAIEKIFKHDEDTYDHLKELCGGSDLKLLVKSFLHAAKGDSNIVIPGMENVNVNDFSDFLHKISYDGKEFKYCAYRVEGPIDNLAELFSNTLHESNLLYVILEPLIFIFNNFILFVFIGAILISLKIIWNKFFKKTLFYRAFRKKNL